MIRSSNTANAISRIFCEATKEILEKSTDCDISYSSTIQKVPLIHMRPEIGSFVQFTGDYSGLMIMNFSAGAAMAIYRNSMLKMGFPEEELASEYTADEVSDSIGELINQTIGRVRSSIEAQYGLVASNTQPKAIALTTSINLSIEAADYEQDQCRRLSFHIDGHSFHIELSMERTEFIAMDNKQIHAEKGSRIEAISHVNMDEYSDLKRDTNEPEAKEAPTDDLDIEALMAANKKG